MIKLDVRRSTTVTVVALPTPSAPPLDFRPLKQANQPDVCGENEKGSFITPEANR